MSSLPNSWSRTVLSTALEEIESGSRPKGGVKNINSGIPSLGAEHISVDGKFNFHKIKYIPEAFAASQTRGKLCQNDILIVKDGATTGRVGFVGNDFPFASAYVNEHVFRCRLNEKIGSPKFFYWYLFSAAGNAEILKNFRGAAQGGIIKSFAQNVTVPVPPVAEQDYIISKLDSAAVATSNIRARLESLPITLKNLRQQLINKAVSGELTWKWRKQSKAQEWLNTTLLEVIKDRPRNGFSPKPADFETSTKSLTLTATTSGKFNPAHFKYINQTIGKDSHLWLEDGDILIQRANTLEYVGVSAIFRGNSKNFIYPDLMMKIKPKSLILSEFLYFILSSDETRNYYRNNATGISGNMPKINQKIVSSTPIRLPSINEQTEIVRVVTSVLTLVDKVEDQCRLALSQLNHAFDSALRNAFNGTLSQPWREKQLKLFPIDFTQIVNAPKPRAKTAKVKTDERNMKQSIKLIIDVLSKSEGELSTHQLFDLAGYSIDAQTDDVSRFFNDIQSQINLGLIIRRRQDNDDFFRLATTESK